MKEDDLFGVVPNPAPRIWGGLRYNTLVFPIFYLGGVGGVAPLLTGGAVTVGTSLQRTWSVGVPEIHFSK